jgi:hypothetical protein
MENNKTVEIVKISKVTIKGYTIETSFITDVEIYESITQPGITGFMSIKDYQALQEIGYIFADDEVTITFGVDNDEANELNLKFKVFTNEGSRQLALNTYDFLRIGFCSPWLIDGLSRLLSKPYENKFVHEIVKDLLLECGAEIGFIEPTKTKLENFVTPLWTPYHSIKHILGFAINENKIGGYLCWTDLKTGKVNVTTLDYMLKGTLGKYENPGFIVNPANLRYVGRVKSMSIESSYDTIRTINTGLPNIKYHALNYDTNKIVTTKNDITQDKQTRLGTKFPILNKYKDKKYITNKFVSLFPETANSIASDETKITDLLNGLESANYAMLATDIFKINIETLGETKRRVGWLADLQYPSVAANSGSGGDKTDNKMYKGYYLIREIKHQFSLFDDYNQYITLVSDGYKELPIDLISWTK